METIPLTRRPARTTRPRRALALALASALLLVGCGRASDDGPSGAAPTEISGPQQVTGIPGIVRWDLSPSGTQVFVAGSPQDAPILPDEAAITAFGTAITTYLDAVLTERNNGQSTTFAASGLDVAGFEAAFGFTSGAAPDTQIVAATYLIEINHLGGPAWALARVELELVDLNDQSAPRTERRESFVFVPTPGSGVPQLVSFEAVK
jgi:hypothetical protein